uniref:Uncharacterized protein n=1 Tax=Steinernema glaseri TaxID=37863 RepID=A0A1I7YV09_9BILA
MQPSCSGFFWKNSTYFPVPTDDGTLQLKGTKVRIKRRTATPLKIGTRLLQLSTSGHAHQPAIIALKTVRQVSRINTSLLVGRSETPQSSRFPTSFSGGSEVHHTNSSEGARAALMESSQEAGLVVEPRSSEKPLKGKQIRAARSATVVVALEERERN